MGTDGKFSHISLRTNQKLQETLRLSSSFLQRFHSSIEELISSEAEEGVGAEEAADFSQEANLVFLADRQNGSC
jgi:hypothetical protein